MKHNKLTAYSLMASSFLFAKNDLMAEIVYTDIVPDIVLENDDDLDLDIDLNGINDFRFFLDSGLFGVLGGYYGSYSYSSILNEVQNMRALCFGDNAMVTQYFTSTSKGTIYFFASLDPLASNVMINEDAFNLVDASQIHIARKQRTVSATSYEPLGDWLYSNWSNPWNYNLLHGEDRFAGIQFYDENDCLHYGWIRCAVVDSNEQLVIKDYAFETFCGWGIETADTSGGHVAINENNLPGVNIYCTQSNIIIDLDQSNENTTLNIYDITGKLIYAGNIETSHAQIPFNHKGNYLVVINQQGKKLVKKIVMI